MIINHNNKPCIVLRKLYNEKDDEIIFVILLEKRVSAFRSGYWKKHSREFGEYYESSTDPEFFRLYYKEIPFNKNENIKLDTRY